jgi:hypothetical protein
MYFCPNCSYIFDISKSSKVTKENDTRVVIKKFVDVIKKIEDNEDLTKYKADFPKDEMTKNKKYQKMTDLVKVKINQLFEELITSGAEFKCSNCNFTKQIVETTLLFQINMEDKDIKVKTLEENKLIIKNPILPHTHDYTCKNPLCETHKNPKIKDSVFYKDNKSYKVNYICCACNYSW